MCVTMPAVAERVYTHQQQPAQFSYTLALQNAILREGHSSLILYGPCVIGEQVAARTQ